MAIQKVKKGTNNNSNNSNNNNKQINANSAQETPNKKGNTKGKKQNKTFKCINCDESHSIYGFKKFLDLDVDGRLKITRSKMLCEMCFSPKHPTAKCPKTFGCQVENCTERHNSLLHKITRSVNVNLNTSTLKDIGVAATEESACCTFTKQLVLLATAEIWLSNDRGDRISVTAFIDPGSMRSFVSKRVVSALNLRTTPIEVGIKGLGNPSMAVAKSYRFLRTLTMIF